jgi:hypothetical protein
LTLLASNIFAADEPHRSGEHNPFEEHIVWQTEPGGYALFIPEALMQYDARVALPIAFEQQVSAFEEIGLAEKTRFESDEKKIACANTPHLNLTSKHPAADAVALEELLAGQTVVVAGSVVDVRAGWGVGGAQTLVYLQVEEILVQQKGPAHGPTEQRTVRVGDIVSITVNTGRVFVDGEVLCNQTDAGVDMPGKGDRVLGSGFPFVSDAYALGRGFLFRLEGELIEPTPYSKLARREPAALSDLRRGVERAMARDAEITGGAR